MADPATALTAISIGSTIGGSVLGAKGATQQGEASARMYTYQAGVAKINKDIAKSNADYAREAGEVEAQASGMKTRFGVGETKAKQGASNLDVSSGSASSVRESMGDIGRQNQAIIRSNAAKKAYGYEVEAAQNEAQSTMYEMSAEQSKKAGKLNAISSLLGGASSVASKWIQARNVGIGSGTGGSGGYTQANPSGSWAPEDI